MQKWRSKRRRKKPCILPREAIPLAACSLAAAALVCFLTSGRVSEWYQRYSDDGDAAVLAEATAPVPTPVPLSVRVTETEPVAETALQFDETESLPRVLIYHTHASEAYLQTEDEPYVESGSWRTLDNGSNVVAIGALLQETLLSEYGVRAIHDTKNYEAPKLASAYNRSLVAMERVQREYPSVTCFVDVHRDAYGANSENIPQDYVVINGSEVARIMLVVGTGEGATGSGFGKMPDFAANYALAEAVTAVLRQTDVQLARNIRVKTGRYNQHVSSACMLVEVGHTANTLSQAKNAVPYLAGAIAGAIKSVPGEGTLETMRIWTP